jgi:hypothetical protein
MMVFTLGLGIIVAVLTTHRVAILESATNKEKEKRRRTICAVSRQLVQAQELVRHCPGIA